MDNIKETSESRELARVDDDIKKIKNPNSSWYYASLILINIISLIISFLYLDYNGYDVQKISQVFADFDYKYVCLLIVCFLIIIFLQTMPIFLRLYAKSKRKNFASVLGGVVAGEFYGRVTLFAKGKNPIMINVINRQKLKEHVAVDSVYGHDAFDKISFMLYSFVMFVVGIIFYLDKTNIVLLLISAIVLLINMLTVVYIFLFNSNKKLALTILAKLVRFAYNIRLISNYEKTYNRIVDKLIIIVKDFRTNKALIFVDIFANILRIFLKCCAMYFILVSLNFADGNAFGELLFKCVILQLIINVWPVQNGTFIFELIFAILFKNVFFEGYVWWGIILYRFFDYFLYVLAYLIFKVFDKIIENGREHNEKI